MLPRTRKMHARTTASHDRWDTDPHRRENANELAAYHGHGCQQKFLPAVIRFAQDRIAVIEGVEKLRQLKRMLGKISRLGGRDALRHSIRGLSRRQPELPDVIRGFAAKEASKIPRRNAACRVSARTSIARREILRVQSTLAENIGGTDHGILRVRACVPLKAQSVLEIESDHGLFRELKHEVAQCSNGELRSNARALRFAQLSMTPIHFYASRRDQCIQ